MEWERGSLLKKYTTAGVNRDKIAEYSYNNQGIRYKKKVGNDETTYYLDGVKIICEKGKKNITFIYDIEGMYGFKYDNEVYPYRYVKDVDDNVISILDLEGEVAHYEYDAWGNCTVRGSDGNITTDSNHIGNINPIRWKSQYYDTESGLYYINGRYYSPLIKQYISMENVEVASMNAGIVYGLNLYLLTIANPVNMMYNGYTIATNTKLTYVQPGLNGWQRFWRSKGGEGLAFGLYIAGLLLSAICPAFAPLFFIAIAITAVTLVIGGSIAGISSKRQGKGFWSGFNNHINQNWSQSLGISIALTMITFGISQAVQAIANAGSKVKLANSISDGKTIIHDHAPHGLPEHNTAIEAQVTEMNNSNLYSDIYVNRALKTAGYTGNQRPDIMGILRSPDKDIVARALEVAGKTQITGPGLSTLNSKIDLMNKVNPNVFFDKIIFPTY